MVSGHLAEKKGYYYAVLNYKGLGGKRETKWISTGFPLRGNKKKAEEKLTELRANFEVPEIPDEDQLLFSDYITQWLEGAKPNIELSTYASYYYYTKKISMYFEEKGIRLTVLEAKDIQDFYTYALKEWNVKGNTVIHYHALIRKSLQYAAKMKMIPTNPTLNVERPKLQRFVGSFYEVDEINQMLEATKGTKIYLAAMLASFYGFRRSEIVGLKWNAIDFKNKTITVKHTVTQSTLDGTFQLIAKDRAKTKSSLRSLPLVPVFEELLKELKANQAEYKRLCGKCYNYDFDGYIYVDEMGELIKPNFLTQNFSIVLKNHGLRKIRFHDLRHSCASLLLANGVSLKEIQEWLGHADFSTTANLYAHLDKSTKTNSANVMLNTGINFAQKSMNPQMQQ